MAAELNDDRRELVRAAAEDARMELETAYDGTEWCLSGPPASIYRFMAELGARNSIFARLLADCITEDGQVGTVRTWRFPAYEWGEPAEDDDYWPDIDIDETEGTTDTKETTQS